MSNPHKITNAHTVSQATLTHVLGRVIRRQTWHEFKELKQVDQEPKLDSCRRGCSASQICQKLPLILTSFSLSWRASPKPILILYRSRGEKWSDTIKAQPRDRDDSRGAFRERDRRREWDKNCIVHFVELQSCVSVSPRKEWWIKGRGDREEEDLRREEIGKKKI